MPRIQMMPASLIACSLPDLGSHYLILVGDLNCCLDLVLGQSSAEPGVVTKSASLIQSFLSDYGISDVWWFLHPKERQYSFFSSVHHTYSRIDYIFIDNRVIPQASSCTYQSILLFPTTPLLWCHCYSLTLHGP